MGHQDHLLRSRLTGRDAGLTGRDAGLTGPGGGVWDLAGWVRRWYGARPLHLLALLAAFALAGYAVRGVVAAGQWRGFALWFAVAIVGHDLLLFPLYSLADLSLRRLLPGRPAGRRHDGRRHDGAATPPDPPDPAAPRPAASSAAASSPGGPEIPFSQTRIYDPRPAPASDCGPGGPSPGHSGPAGSGSPQSSSRPAQSGPARFGSAHASPAGPPVINYVRVPAAFSLLLLLVWFPLILGLSARTYHRASGLVTSPYLARWLVVTGVLFAASAVSYALALRRAPAPAAEARRASRHRRRRFH
jgi:hypothetical protein